MRVGLKKNKMLCSWMVYQCLSSFSPYKIGHFFGLTTAFPGPQQLDPRIGKDHGGPIGLRVRPLLHPGGPNLVKFGWRNGVTSGKLTVWYGKSPSLIGKSPISSCRLQKLHQITRGIFPLPRSLEIFHFDPGMDGFSERDAVTPSHRQVQRLPCHPQTPGTGCWFHRWFQWNRI